VIVAFGPRAEAYARGLGDVALEAIVADGEHLPQAYFAAVERRVTGRPFYGMILFEDSAALTTSTYASVILDQFSGYDDRASALDQLAQGTLGLPGGSTVAETWWTSQAATTELMRDFFALCDAMLVRSQIEYARLSAFCVRPRPAEPILAVPAVPAVARRLPQQPAVVIWAPDRPSSLVTFEAFALQEFHGLVTCVTSDGHGSELLSARFVTAGDPAAAEALATASCIVCVDPSDPGAAVAFARLEYGIAAPLASGAHEFISGVVPYDAKTLDGIYAAVAIAIGSPAALRQVPPAPPPLPRRPAYPLPLDALPTVSIVVPTYNRRQDLTRALACLTAQTYPRVEILVVNDAGEDVSDIVAAAPGARYLVMPENGGVLKTEMMGIAAAGGDYIQLLGDDDFLAPDHCEALVTAMLVSGASMAHGNCLIRYQEAISPGEYATVGYNARMFNETVTPSIALIATPISGNSIMIHRRVFEAVGPYRADCMLADQELQMRALQRFAFVYVDRMTAEWRARGKENFSTGVDSTPELRRMYDELHPQPSRPDVERRRNQTLERIANRPKGVFAFPPSLKFPPMVSP
jgi:GT2 family glycosyltransferase